MRDYLVKILEILVEMSNALRAKQESQQAENDKTLIQAHAKQLYSNQDPESGNPKGSLTVVEFFDYNCGYCKRAHPSSSNCSMKTRTSAISTSSSPS